MPEQHEQSLCAVCGCAHPRSEGELAYRLPDPVARLSRIKRAIYCRNSDDVCLLRYTLFGACRIFVRAVLPLEVVALPGPSAENEPYRIGVWVELPNKQVFERFVALWESERTVAHKPIPGRLANEVRFHPGSEGLPLELRFTDPRHRPSARFTDSSHSLEREQAEGISSHRVAEYNSDF